MTGYYKAQTGTRAVDTHRGTLSEARTFLGWCVKRGWLHENPLAKVEGVGRRRTGKPQLTIEEARKFTDDRAHPGGQAEGRPRSVGGNAALANRDARVGDHQLATPGPRRRRGDSLGAGRKDRSGTTTFRRARCDPPSPPEDGEAAGAGGLPLRAALPGLAEGECPAHLQACRPTRSDGARASAATHATLAEGAGATGVPVAQALGHEHVSTTHKHYTLPGAVTAATQERTLRVIGGGRRAELNREVIRA